MGLLQALKLPQPPGQNTAKRGAVRRAKLAARIHKGDRREVLNAAIDMAARSDSNSLQDLDTFVSDKASETPVSKMAPRKAYDDPEGAVESKDVPGWLEHETEVGVWRNATEDGKVVTPFDFQVTTTVISRGLEESRIGNGERLYKKDDRGRLRKPDGIKSPESLVMRHEHLHLVVAAHISKRMEEFADAAFSHSKLTTDDVDALRELLPELAREAGDEVDAYLDRFTTADRPEEIEKAEARSKQLLADGTLERLARTALLDVLRKNSKKLAAFRK